MSISNADFFWAAALQTGFDACGHMSEETKNADVSAPWGIIVALGTSAVVGWGYIMALLFSIQVQSTLAASILLGPKRKSACREMCFTA